MEKEQSYRGVSLAASNGEITSDFKNAQLNAQAPETHQPLRFQGQYYDVETGLHYNRFRYYEPDAGRYISPDPIGLVGGNNLFDYVPSATSWIDPLGLNPFRGAGGRYTPGPNGPVVKPPSTGHGNSTGSDKCTTLYKLENPDGSLSKWGITSEPNPRARYTRTEMNGREMTSMASGSRADMIALERLLTMSKPGAANLEAWAGTGNTSLTSAAIITAYAAARPCVKVMQLT